MACINPNNPTFQTLAKKLGSYMLAEVEFSKLQKEDFVIQNNGTFLNTSEEKRKEIFENYVNLMDRKREGKSISFDKFNQMFDNLQVFKHKNTFIFGEWDVKNNVFKGRLMSSPGIKELYGALDVLFANTDFVASVPSDIGSMLERKGLYKLDIGKEYNFKGEEMVKNLYFSNKELVEKIFKTTPENVTTEQVKKYDEFFNYWSLINKLKKEYESKNFDNLLSILKEIGIYDYNAYKLVKKIKQGKITNADTEAVVKEIIKNSAINKVNIDNTDLINNPKVYDELNTELNKTLATYLSKFGVKTELLEDMQDELGIDSFAHIDILNKILYADKNNQENYPQQAGKTIAFMMQHNPYMQEITSKMKKLSMFKGLTNDELFEAVGDLISEELHKKTNTELPKDLIESIKNLIKQFFDFLNDIQMSRINKNIGFIADNILLQNQSLITQSVYKPGSVGKKVSKISLEEALKSDVFGNSIVEKMAKYFILTGSITLSEQGTVYRPNENQIHDLDWVSSLTREKSIKIFNELYPNNKYIRNIYNPEYQTDTWLIAPEGYKIENLKIDNSKKTNKIIGYDIVDLNNKIVSSYIPLSDSHTGKVEAKLIDIFSYEKVTEKKTANKEITLDSGTKLKIADWRNTFEAKLKFGRLKDIWDYNRFIPNDNIYKEKTNDISGVKLGVEELFESNPELANAVYEALGFNTIDKNDITYTDEEGNPCAKMGLTNATKGTGWKIVKDFKGKPKHSNGGVDITVSDKGVTMRRGGKDIKAKHGLLIVNNNDYAEDPILTSVYNKYPAFRNMGNVVLKADRTFTRDKTQVGDIEFFDSNKLENNTITYNNGFKVKNPNPNGFGIIYNPDNNNEQNIMLDMLHGMTKDKAYAKHREEFSNAFLNSKYGEDYKREWEQYNKETNGKNDGEQQFRDNWIDGNIRNLMFEGTDEDFKKARYWKDAKKEYLQDKNINRTFGKLKNYLQVGQGYMLPEVTIIANKINNK
jgi:hypothetical protein